MPFTPKFVDLVRNVTTVQGSGPAALGAAVPGYTGMAEAVLPGEQFYYCIQGIDKPAEREVGRGTMQVGGTIVREPIGGTPTSFTGGTKTIALVAAAEWYARIELGSQAGQGSASLTVDSWTALAAKPIVNPAPTILTEAGREGLFVFDASNLSSKVTADTAQGVYVAPTSAPTGASGAWVRKFSGPLDFHWFGAYGNYNPVTPGTLGVNFNDDRPAFMAMLSYLNSVAAQTSGNTSFKQAPPVIFSGKNYYFSEAIDLYQASYDFRGVGRAGSAAGTTFSFAAGKDGLRFQWVDTSGKTGTGSFTSTASGSNIEHIHLWSIGNNAGANVGSGIAFEQDGFTIRCHVTMTSCSATNFSRDGFSINATNGGAMQGNANGCILTDCSAVRNVRAGIFVQGGDANACIFNRFAAYYNGYAGIWDNSFLGNTWNGPEEGDSGGIGAGPYWGNTIVGSFSLRDPGDGKGLHIWQVRRGQAVAASTTAPSDAGNAVWKRLSAVGAGYSHPLYPPWVSGMSFIDGASYIFENISSASAIIGGYTEGTSPAPSILGPTIVVGGVLASAIESGPGLRSASNFISSGMGFQQATHPRDRLDGSVRTIRFGTQNKSGADHDVLYTADGVYTDTVLPDQPAVGLKLGWDAVTKNLQWKDTFSGAVISEITGRYTTHQFGRGAAQPYYRVEPRLMVGTGNTAREIGSGAAMPAVGSYAQGDVIRNTAGSLLTGSNVLLGWYRLTSGAAHVLNTDWVGLYAKTVTVGPIAGTTGDFSADVNVTGSLITNGASNSVILNTRNSGGGWTQYVSGGTLFLFQGGNVFSFDATAGFKSTVKIGYDTGAGGTAAQATSKSTGVTINKACGQVTMNAASLVAGASVSFTLTDSAIGANDEVAVWVKSGASADAYEVSVTAVAAGSCRIQLRNFSAGALAEAVVIGFAVRAAVAA